jgi:hypothetical protein
MSLVIYVSQQTVIISKYNLEFRFQPPAANLTDAAIGAYKLLRQSEILQTESSRNEREEVITLLKHYGSALYQAVIPHHISSEVYKSGGLFVYSLDKEVINLPWELLYDGSSFIALTQGIVRIHKSSTEFKTETASFMFPHLKLALNSYTPSILQPVSNRLVGYVEELASAAVPRSPLVKTRVDGNASYNRLPDSLKWHPNLFYFSGYDAEKGWVLGNADESQINNKWWEETLKPELVGAIQNGLKIIVLQTSNLLKEIAQGSEDFLNPFFDAGVPYVITINGRVSRSRLKEYFNIFLLGLIREENILRAHRLAINHIQSALPLSWDWSWIRFHINQKLLESTRDNPLPPFHFDRTGENNPALEEGASRGYRLLSSRRFPENYQTLMKFKKELGKYGRENIICLDTSGRSAIEPYIHELLRRSASENKVAASLFYYQRWGFSNQVKTKLSKSKYANLFSFLCLDQHQITNLDKRLVPLVDGDKTDLSLSLLIVISPPGEKDLVFDKWLSEKQKENRQIIFVHEGSYDTSLTTRDFLLEKTEKAQIINSFEDEFPEEWIQIAETKLPEAMEDIALLKMIQKLGNQELIDYLQESPKTEELYRKSLQTILSTLSASRLKIYLSLFLLRIFCPGEFLKSLLDIKGIEADLEYLHQTHLINANLSFDEFWIPLHMQTRLREMSLVPGTVLESHGLELLQKLISCLDRKNAYYSLIETGFQYCIMELARNKILETPLQRNLQIGKKLSRKTHPKFRLTDNLTTSLELALLIGKGQLIQKTLFTIVETLEYLHFGKETIAICELLLQVEKKHRNWPLVSTIQMKAAGIFARMNKKEKAIGLISSALKLNNDINNFSNRHQNLITIALLLLDLEEFDKLSKLLSSTQFDMSLLNREDVAKLWLIDAHLLYSNKKYKEAEISFEKVLKENPPVAQDSLMAKTYSHLASLSRMKRDQAATAYFLEQSVIFIEACGEMEKAADLHQELYNLCTNQKEYHKAARHLEWIYYFYQNSGNKNQIRKIADQLGVLYFKIGEHAKSTDFYSIAQGI